MPRALTLSLDPALAAKRERALLALRAAVAGTEAGKLAVAFSGGVDSTLLLALAVEALGPARVVAVTARSESLAEDELASCQGLAARLGVTLRLLETQELARAGYRENSPQRCYHCKTELFEAIDQELLAAGQVVAVAYGATADDVGDHRPGMRAASEHRVLAPLLEAGLGKQEIRLLSQALDLPTWDKPAQPCLASRIPYGEGVTAEKLRRIDRAEALLRALGVREGRVRHHGEGSGLLARVEVPLAELPALVAGPARERLVAGLRGLGFAYVVVDLEGFRSGRQNELVAGNGGGEADAVRRLPVAGGGV